MYNISIEYDDAGPAHPIGPRMWDILENFREHYPDFKVTLFTIPLDLRHGKIVKSTDEEYKSWAKIAKKAYDQGWCRFALHGFNHIEREFEHLTYDEAKKRIEFGKAVFESVGIPIDPIFKAPNWFISSEAERAVKDAGLKLVKDRYYQWNLKDRLPRPVEFGDKVIIAHGHIQDGDGCFNGLSETKHRVMELPSDTKFIHLIDAI
tara:strand:- start:14494 stop:15111 length:618 start_codon:yes stop_codon:yes gene_type:complete